MALHQHVTPPHHQMTETKLTIPRPGNNQKGKLRTKVSYPQSHKGAKKKRTSGSVCIVLQMQIRKSWLQQ